MPYIKLADGTEIGVSVEELISATKSLFKNTTPYLNYDSDKIIAYYSKTRKWLTYTGPFGEIKAPYVCEYDFRNRDVPKHWGVASCKENFEFPLELHPHRTKMVAKFEKERKVSKGNRPCPRVFSFSETSGGELHLGLHKAMYYDQVGTNLSLDYPFDSPIERSGVKFKNCRDWDIANGEDGVGVLPTLEKSRLANTIGVAVGVTAKDQFGQRQIIKRLRSGNVAVYENQWHVPFSFALAWPEGFDPGETLSLSELINRDYGHELAEELPGIEPTDFEPPQPLAFCRDMVRGGKPQFFFEIRSRLSVDELRKRVRPDGAEYKNKTGIIDGPQPELSSELFAFAVLVGMPI